jgi:hypothetical protein
LAAVTTKAETAEKNAPAILDEPQKKFEKPTLKIIK